MRNRSAFTIVELLVVVGIILVIMSLMVPTVSKAMEKSNISAAKAMLEKLEMAVRNYQSAYGQWPLDLTYQYLGKKLPSYNFGTVLPLLQYEKDFVTGTGDAREYIDPWGERFVFFWVAQGNATMTAQYEILVGITGTSALESASPSQLSQVIGNIGATNYNANTASTHVLIPGFLLWSKGPDLNSGSADDIGNWGKTRSKMVSGVS